jgi:hypothetical protein
MVLVFASNFKEGQDDDPASCDCGRKVSHSKITMRVRTFHLLGWILWIPLPRSLLPLHRPDLLYHYCDRGSHCIISCSTLRRRRILTSQGYARLIRSQGKGAGVPFGHVQRIKHYCKSFWRGTLNYEEVGKKCEAVFWNAEIYRCISKTWNGRRASDGGRKSRWDVLSWWKDLSRKAKRAMIGKGNLLHSTISIPLVGF